MKRKVLFATEVLNKNVIVALLLLLTNSLTAQNGSITGKVTDSKNSEPLIGAAVTISGTTTGSATDFDGNYTIPNVKSGTYTLNISYISYKSHTKSGVVVEADKPTLVDISMESADISLNEVQVVANAKRESDIVLMMEQKKATLIRESVGAKQLSMQGVSDAATAAGKITGVVRSGSSGEVYVRGLGDRYLSTTMNGLPVPSDDVDKKNIDLGLFETSVIQNVGISKTYDPESYIDQSAGNVNIVSKEFTAGFSIELQGGLNSGVLNKNVFKNFSTSPNLNNSFMSFYSRPQTLVQAITKQSWDPGKRKMPVDFGISTLGGLKFDLFEKPLSIFYTLSYKRDFSYSAGIYRRFNANTVYSDFLDTESWTFNENFTGLMNFSYRLNGNNKLNYNFLLVNKLFDNVYEQGKDGKGYKFDMDQISDSFFARDMNTRTTRLLVNQLLGEHNLSENNKLDWGVGFNLAGADEPNRIRTYTGFYNNELYFSYRISDFENRKSSQEINDKEINGYVKNRYDFKINKKDIYINSGLNFRNKIRDFEADFVGVDLRGITAEPNVDNISSIFAGSSFSDDLIKTIPPDMYDAGLNAYAAFTSVGFDLGKLEGNAGLRYEIDLINVKWKINNDDPLRKPRIERTYSELYPSFNLKYELNDKHYLRFSGSKTITLPEFKEIAPFAYTSPNSTIIQGTPELRASVNYNADLKWEYFKSNDELISGAVFYKNIKDPINITALTGGAGYLVYANTGEQANVYGVELEARLNLYKSTDNAFRMILNGTRMWVKQDLLEQFQYNNKTSSGLQGAAEYIANISLNYENYNQKWLASITGNFSSDKIFAMGSPKDAVNRDYLYNDDIIEKGYITLDAVLSKELSEKLTLKLVARNILNPEMQLTQNLRDLNSREVTNFVVDSHRKGLKLQVSVNYKF